MRSPRHVATSSLTLICWTRASPHKTPSSSSCGKTRQQVNWSVGWLFFTPHRQRGHLETAPPFTVPCEGRGARFVHLSHRESNPGPSQGFHYTTAAPRQLHTLCSRLSLQLVWRRNVDLQPTLGENERFRIEGSTSDMRILFLFFKVKQEQH